MEENPRGDRPENGESKPPFDYQQHYRQQSSRSGPGGPWRPEAPRGPEDSTVAFSMLAYIPFLWLVGLLADRNNPTVKFHVNQGIILTVFECVLSFVLSIAKGIISLLFSFTIIFSGLSALLNGLLSLAGIAVVLAYTIVGIINASKQRQVPLPLIGTLFTVLR